MSTTTIDGKQYTLTEETDGKMLLTPVEAPKEERNGRCGDVHEGYFSDLYIRGNEEGTKWIFMDDTDSITAAAGSGAKDKVLFNIQDVANGDYVRKADVVAALSIEDEFGDSVLDGRYPFEKTIRESRCALAALGIKPIDSDD